MGEKRNRRLAERRRPVYLVVASGWVTAMLVVAGCSDGGQAALPSTGSTASAPGRGDAGGPPASGPPSAAGQPSGTGASSPSDEASTTLASTTTLPGPLTRAQACARFAAIGGDGTMTSDAQWSATLGTLAGQTADPDLAAAIRRLADRYAVSAAAVSPVEVNSLCE